jgi:ABC-type nitrate/sulfonate/bicarbonate transport system substrate-binding protein
MLIELVNLDPLYRLGHAIEYEAVLRRWLAVAAGATNRETSPDSRRGLEVRMRRRRKTHRFVAFVAALALAATACGGPDAGTEGTRDTRPISVVFGTAGEKEFDNMPFLIAEQEGYFTEEGLDLEIVHFSGGGGDLVSGFAGERVDLGFTSFASALRGMVAGVPIKIVAETSTFPVFWGLIVPTDSDIQSVDDLEAGDRIAITSEGGLTHYVALLILAQAGLSPNDVTLVPLGVGPEMPAALRAGEIEAAIAFPPNGPLLENEGVARYVVSLQELVPNFTFAGIIASEKAIDEKPEAIAGLLRAYQRGLEWMEENPEESVAFIEEKYEIDPEISRQLYEAGMENFNRTGEINMEGLEFVLSTSAEYGFLEEELTVEEAADTFSALASPELHHILTVDRGWSQRRYARWLQQTVKAALL